LKEGAAKDNEEIIKDAIQLVRKNVGPFAAFKEAIIIKKLPKTRSGKVARNTLAAMIANLPYKIPVTIEDATVYEDIISVLKAAGFNASRPQQ